MLSPYRVVDLTDGSANFAGFVLAMLGADVVAVEAPEGSAARRMEPFAPDGSSLTHAAFNRGKRSVCVDPDDTEGYGELQSLLGRADVVLLSGTAAELAVRRLSPGALCAAHPALVAVTVSPFGQSGPKAGWHATDLTVWASSGSMALCGDADRAPLALRVPQAFLHAGAQAAAAAVIGLIERARSGQGQHVDVSAQAVCMQATQSAALNALARAPLAVRSGGGMASGQIFLRFVYPAADGHVSITHVFGSAVGPATRRLMEAVHDAGFCDAATRDKDWLSYGMALSDGSEPLSELDRVQACVAAFTASRSKAELFALALDRRLLLAPVATPAEVACSEQLADRDYWDRLDGMRWPGPWAKASATPLRRLGAAPHLGADTATVRREWLPANSTVARPRNPVESSAVDPRPLVGLTVVDFMWAVAGPTLSRVLADAGATVIRIESATKLDAARAFQPFFDDRAGAENSALFNNMAAGKQSVSLNLTKPEARQVALELCARADVVCEAYSPRAMRAWRLDYEHVAAVNPGVVMLSTCLFGQSGPLASFAGYGNLAAAMTGFHGLAGWADRDPVGPYGAYTDYASPHLALATLLGAIDHRARTGEGQYIDFSQAEASIHFLSPALLDAQLDTQAVSTDGNHHPQFCPHGVFPAAGRDQWVAIVAQGQPAWRALAALIGRSDLADLPLEARLERRQEIESLVCSWSAARTADEIEQRCQNAGVAAHRVQNGVELAADPQLQARAHWVRVEHSLQGETVVEASRFALSRTPIGPTRGAPLIGEHLHEVLSGLLGYDEDRIAALAAAECFD